MKCVGRRYACRMGLIFDSFGRALAYCLMPRVVLLSLLPLVLLLLGVGAGWYLFWDAAVAWMHTWLQGASWLGTVWGWLQQWGISDASAWVAPVLVVLTVTPLLVMACLLLVSIFVLPAMVSLVAQRRFPQLERKRGGSTLASLWWTVSSTVLALVALLVSMPLWLIPPLVLVLPPLIWGWLTYRVTLFDALAEHASSEERKQILGRYQVGLLAMGVACGFLGAAPGIVWISGLVFAAAFVVLIPVALWIYTWVFVFSSLWFVHFSLAALARLREEQPVVAASESSLLPASPEPPPAV